MRGRNSSLVLAVAVAVAVAVGAIAMVATGCHDKSDAKRNATSSGKGAAESDVWFRVEAMPLEEAPVPFLLGLDHDSDRAWIDNGDEKLPAQILNRDPLKVRIPAIGTELTFRGPADDKMEGIWHITYYETDVALQAKVVSEPSAEALFPGEGAPTLSLAGEWRMEVGRFGTSRAVFTQDEHGVLGGSILLPEIGDMRFLKGRVWGDQFALSVFDGVHGWMVSGRGTKGGDTIIGRWVIVGIGGFDFTAVRGSAPTVDSLMTARVKEGATSLSLPALQKAPYAGAPVIVDFFGTWCPQCIDLTPELVRLRSQYKSQGLQVLSIALEPEGDRRDIDRRLQEFRERSGVNWPIELRIGDDLTANVPPEIENATGFPITIWIRRDGSIAGVHTGYVSRALPAEHALITKKFNDLTREIVESKPAAE